MHQLGRDVAIATITRARSAREEALLRRSLAVLTRRAAPIAVADAGTSPTFSEFLQGCAGIEHISASNGLVAQVKASLNLAAAYGTPYILYTEPDKELFFLGGIVNVVRYAVDNPHVGLVLASRSERSFETFPPMQRQTESS